MIDGDWRRRLRRRLLRDGQIWNALAFAFLLCAGSGTVFLTSHGHPVSPPESPRAASVSAESAPGPANGSAAEVASRRIPDDELMAGRPRYSSSTR